MIQGATHTIQIELPEDISIADLDAAVFSFAQQDAEIVKKTLDEMMTDAETNSLIIELSQQETLRFTDNALVDMQLKIKRQGTVDMTDIVRETVSKAINKEVI